MVNTNVGTNHMIATIKECRPYLKPDKILIATKVYQNSIILKEDIGEVSIVF